ncbi:MAG: peptidyl-prolyl cis-trans isomerase, partial [Alphaproteobacteria bacterium]
NRLVVSDDTLASQIISRARSGESLVNLGRELLNLEEADIKNEATAKADMPAEQAATLFALPHNGVSEPVDSAFGKVILQVTAIYSGSTQSFDEVKGQLKDQLAEDLALDQLYALVDEIEDMRAGGSSLKEIATAKSLPIETTALTSVAGRDIDGGPVNGLPADPAFLETAFTLSSGETGDMIETNSGDYLLLHVDQVNEKALRPYDDVKKLVAYHSKLKAQLEAANTAAGDLKAAAVQKGSLAAAAKAKGYDVQTADRVTRASTGSIFSAEMLTSIFDASKGDILVGANAGVPMVAELAAVKKITAEDEQETYQFVRTQIAQGLGSDLSNLYQVALEKAYGVEIYQQALQRLYTSADEQ